MALINGTTLDELPTSPDGLQNVAVSGSSPAFGELGFSIGFGAGFLLGVQESVLREVTRNVATIVSTYVIDKQSGDPHLVTANDIAGTVIRLKKVGSGFSTILPTITARDTFVDISLTALNLDTLGICDLTVDMPGCIVAPIRMNVIAIDKNDSVTSGLSSLTSLLASNASILTVAQHLEKAGFNRWKIDGTQLIIFDDDGVTPLETFDLKDDTGAPSNTKIFERVPAP